MVPVNLLLCNNLRTISRRTRKSRVASQDRKRRQVPQLGGKRSNEAIVLQMSANWDVRRDGAAILDAHVAERGRQAQTARHCAREKVGTHAPVRLKTSDQSLNRPSTHRLLSDGSLAKTSGRLPTRTLLRTSKKVKSDSRPMNVPRVPVSRLPVALLHSIVSSNANSARGRPTRTQAPSAFPATREASP